MSKKILTSLDLSLNQLIQVLAEVIAGNPGSGLNNGRFWYNSTTNKFMFRENGVSQAHYADTVTLDAITLAAADLSMNTHKITALVDPSTAQEAATKNYVDGRRLDQAPTTLGSVSMNSFNIVALANPVNGTDAANKTYVDNVAQGVAPKESVRAATTANGALATAYENGDIIDGVTLATGNRILLKDQTTGADNGIYTVNASGAPTRATDADSTTDIESAFVFVEEGTVQANTAWVMTTDAVTVGTTAQTWVQFGSASAYIGGAGLTLTGQTFDVNVDGASLEINADTLRVKALGIATSMLAAGAVTDAKVTDVAAGKITGTLGLGFGGTGGATAAAARTSLGTASVFAADITGDGSAVSFAVTHNLGTKDVVVQVWEATTDAQVDTSVVRTSTNVVTVGIDIAPANAKVYRVVIFAKA